MEAYQELEQKFAEWNDLDPQGMVVCSSGTAALHLALEALQLPQGSEVVTPDFSMIATARAISLAGLMPVFVDCGDDLLIDPDLAKQALTKQNFLGALLVVHIYGRVCAMDELTKYSCLRGGFLIEDLAEAHGVKPHPRTDAATWSFYHNKIIAGEEGGAVWFRNPAHAKLARSLRTLGFTQAHDFNHIPRGHNYRLSNVHAELILESLKHVQANLIARRWIESTYDQHCPPEWKMPPRDAPWVYDLRIPGLTCAKQDAIVAALNQEGIAARHAFKPLSKQEEYQNCRLVAGREVTNATIASWEIIYLPLTPGTVTEKGVARAFAIIKNALQN